MEPTRTTRSQRRRRSFTDGFKTGAIALVLKEGKTVAQVAQDLDLTPSALSQWVKQGEGRWRQGPTGRAHDRGQGRACAAPQGELRASDGARHPKKAAAFFAKEST